MPETYTKEQIDEAKEWFGAFIGRKNYGLHEKYGVCLLSALSTAERERDALKAQVAELEARLQGAPQVYADIMAERKRQDEKWGVQRHHPTEWLSILGEEFGEVCKAVCEAHFSGYESTGKWDQYRVELIHTAAVAVSMIECHDAIVGKEEG